MYGNYDDVTHLLKGVDVVGCMVQCVVCLKEHVEVANVEGDVKQSHQQKIVEPFQF